MRKHTFAEMKRDLAYCTTCMGAEGTLPTECPGKPMTEAEREAIYRAKLDYVDGRWLAGSKLQQRTEMRSKLAAHLEAAGNGSCTPNVWAIVEGVWMLHGPWGCYPTEHPETLSGVQALQAELDRWDANGGEYPG